MQNQNMSNRKNPKKSSSISLFLYLRIFIGLFSVGWFFYTIAKNSYERNLLATEPVRTIKAIVINKKNFPGNKGEPTYSYRYFVDGKYYEGDTDDYEYHPLDTVTIKYVISNPEISERVSRP
ncbi:hypothetical protein [Mucilaginibacter defluvii]|uniref:DUF3592 domain-containing protein n=1 Tax=Mucilaginibacter defluvii TaxID=1196019 RepID=A0ABP9FYW8_9SPHI